MESFKAFFGPFSEDINQTIIIAGLIFLGLNMIAGIIKESPFIGGLIVALILGSAIYEGHKSLARHILRERAKAEMDRGAKIQ